MSDRPYRQAMPDIPCVDVWRLEDLNKQNQAAYSALAKRGEIYVDRITVQRNDGIAVIEYRSTCPQDWTREALRREKEKME